MAVAVVGRVEDPAIWVPKVRPGGIIAGHDFFADLSWPDLLTFKIRPPFKSKAASTTDTQNFHKAFTQQQPIDSLTDISALLTSEQEANFEDFAYNPNAMTAPAEGEAAGEASADAPAPVELEASSSEAAAASSDAPAEAPVAEATEAMSAVAVE